MNKRIRQVAMLSLLGFIIGTAMAWYQVNEEISAGNANAYAKIEPAAGASLAGSAIGGDFTLTDQDGKQVSAKDYEGSYKLVYFGYTSCPDVCPAGLKKIASAMSALGPKAKDVQPIFITIDPQRDTPDVMKQYVEMFHPKLVGLTGTPEQVKAVEAEYKVYSEKAHDPAMNGYTMNHSSYTYFMGPDNKPLTMFSSQDTPADMVKGMMQIMGQKHDQSSL